MDPELELGTVAVSDILEQAYVSKIGVPPPAGEPVAVIVTHGMGQQVPYETIEDVAEAIWRGAEATSSPSLIRWVRLGTRGKDDIEPELVRAEIQVQHAGKMFDVHIYEAYWAPLTEGKVTLKDVMSFLFGTGWNGLWNAQIGIFRRWMFGKEQYFKLRKLLILAILAFLMLLLISLVIMNAVLVAAATSHAIGASEAFPGKLTGPLTADFIVADIAAVLIFLGTFGIPWLCKKLTSAPGIPRGLSILEWILTGAGAMLILAAGFAMPPHMWSCTPERWVWPYVSEWAAHLAEGCGGFVKFTGCLNKVCIAVLWAFEFGAAAIARWFLIEYAGDVPAYVAFHTVSKFYDLRQKIWDTAMKVARAVYRAETQSTANPAELDFLYKNIIVVGHSLGSVISYDVLNGLLLEEAASDRFLNIADRTRMFLTLGSPLDKTAFLFRTQADMQSSVREVAAAAVQPMIQDYSHRAIEWVNLYSKSDIISGALDYYDPPNEGNVHDKKRFRVLGAPRRIHVPARNLLDPAARTPLAAHVEYWQGNLLAKELVRGITT